MSRKGKQPILIPKGVEVKVSEKDVLVNGPKGKLSQEKIDGLDIHVKNGSVEVTVRDEQSGLGSYHGLFRALLNNMILGVSNGFEKKLEMQGVGYRAAVQGSQLDIQVGQSHPLKLQIPKDVQVKVEKNTLIVVSGVCKQGVGQFAASIRAVKPPEPYQGKGIRYVGEYVRKKAGKSAATKSK